MNRLATERQERTEGLMALLEAYFAHHGEMPPRAWVLSEMGIADRTLSNYTDDLVAAGRLTRRTRWNSIRIPNA